MTDIENLRLKFEESGNILNELKLQIQKKKKQVEELSEDHRSLNTPTFKRLQDEPQVYRLTPSTPLTFQYSRDKADNITPIDTPTFQYLRDKAPSIAPPIDPPAFKYLNDRTNVLRIAPATFVDYAANLHGFKRVVVIDCRSPAEYAAGHIRGALNVYCYAYDPEGSGVDAVYDRMWTEDTLWVLHCEFSEVRGPTTWRRLLQHHAAKGRARGSCHAVVLNEGFVSFYKNYRQWCVGTYRSERDCLTKGNTTWYVYR